MKKIYTLSEAIEKLESGKAFFIFKHWKEKEEEYIYLNKGVLRLSRQKEMFRDKESFFRRKIGRETEPFVPIFNGERIWCVSASKKIPK